MGIQLGPNEISIIMLSAVESIAVFTTLMPQRSDLLASSPNDRRMVADTRHGEFMASVIVLSMGGVVSVLSKSTLPFILSIGSILGMIWVYESTLKTDIGEL